MKNTHVYGLFDPRNGKLRYIGRTTDLARRKRSHMHSAKISNYHCARWIKNLIDDGIEPEMKVLETVTGEHEASEIERTEIARARSSGIKLTNMTDGGEGVLNPGKETRYKMGSANRGRKLGPVSKETKQKLSSALMGRSLSEEHKRKLSKAHKGKKLSPESIAKRSAKLRGRKMPARSPEHCAKISAAKKGKPLSQKNKRAIKEAMNKPEIKEKLRVAATGRVLSAQTKVHMSESRVGKRHSGTTIKKMQKTSKKRNRDSMGRFIGISNA